MNNIQVIEQREVLGKDFKIYGTKEEPLFLAKDVAEWIDYSKTSQGYYNVSKMLMGVDDDEKTTITNSNSGGNKVYLTEDGFYEVLMLSRKQIAKDFKKEVKKILKQIRQTGGYIPIKEDDNEEALLAKAFIIAQKTLEKKDLLLQQANKKIEEQQPKVEYHDTVLHCEKLISTTDIAKDLGMSAQKLNSKLNELGVIYKQGKVWKLYSKHQDKIPEYCDYHINQFSQSLKWTEKGRKFIISLLK